MTTALLAASKGNHRDIVKCILLTDISVMPEGTDRLEDLLCVFQVSAVARIYEPQLLLSYVFLLLLCRSFVT